MNQPQKRHLLIPIFITICLDFISIGIVLPVLTPLLINNTQGILPLSSTLAQRTIILGILISSFSIASFFGAPLIGAWSDNIGRKKVLRYSLIASSFCYVLFALGVSFSNIFLLFLGRILGGFAGANVNTCVAAMVDITEPKDRVKNFGLIGFASFACGYIVGPLIGGIYSNPNIVSWFNNSTPFWFVSIWCLMNLAIIEFFFTETLKHRMHEKVSIFSGVKNLSKVFTLPKLKAVFAVAFLITFGFNFFDQFFQVFLIQKFNFNQFQIANMLAVLGVSMAITQGLLVRLIPKWVKAEMVLFLCLPMVAVLMPSLLIPNSPFVLYLILPLIAIFQGLAWPYSSALISSLAREDQQGEVLGINTSLTGLAIGLPPLISGFIAVLNFQLPIILAGISALAAWIIFVGSFKVFRLKSVVYQSE